MKRAKLIKSMDAGNIIKLPDGRFRIDCVDSRGKRHRPAFATKDEALAALVRITAKKSTGKFVAGVGNATFSEALDDLVERNKHEKIGKGHRDGVISVINKHLRPAFGARKLNEFADEQMKFVDDWFKHQASHHRTGPDRLSSIRSVFALAFDEAIRLRKMASPNPVREFKLQIPQDNQKEEREALTLDQMSALVKAVLTRDKQDRNELTWCTRWMMILIGMLAGFRNEECSGLFWDSVHIEDGTIDMNRVWRDGEGIVKSAKSGAGLRTVPVSPILAAAFLAYGQRLKSMGRTLEGPVLIGNASIVKPEAISKDHWNVIARKAGLPVSGETGRHTFYTAGRHTCINLWRAVGISMDDVAQLGGHDIKTSYENYRHSVSISKFKVLGREVEALLGVQSHRSEDLIEGLGRVLYHRWSAEGIDVGCAPPRRSPSLGTIGGGPAQLALQRPGKIIDVVPNAAPELATSAIPKSITEYRKWQSDQAIKLHAEGWTVLRIQAELGADRTTVKSWLRHAHIPDRRGRLPSEVRVEKKQRFFELRAQHPNWTTMQFSEELGVHSNRLTKWAREADDPMPHRTYAYKIGKHEARIRQMVAEGKTYRQMAKQLGEGISFSGVALFVKEKLGLKTKRWGKGERLDQYDTDVIRMVGEGMDGKAIAKALGTVSHSGVCRRMNQLGLKAKRAARGERVEQYDDEIRRLVAEGKNGKQIAKELHTVSHSAICRRINTLGL